MTRGTTEKNKIAQMILTCNDIYRLSIINPYRLHPVNGMYAPEFLLPS